MPIEMAAILEYRENGKMVRVAVYGSAEFLTENVEMIAAAIAGDTLARALVTLTEPTFRFSFNPDTIAAVERACAEEIVS